MHQSTEMYLKLRSNLEFPSLLQRTMHKEMFFNMPIMDKASVTSSLIARWTSTELSVQQHCYLWDSRVIIPKQGRDKLLDEQHQCHPGMVRMKRLAKSIMWWPGDKDIEGHWNELKWKVVKNINNDQKHLCSNTQHPFEFPDQPWHRIHIDHAEIKNKTLLIIINAYSKYIDAHIVASTVNSSHH